VQTISDINKDIALVFSSNPLYWI